MSASDDFSTASAPGLPGAPDTAGDNDSWTSEMTKARKSPLRVALVCGPDPVLEGWQAEILRRIAAEPGLHLAGRITGVPGGPGPQVSGAVRAVLSAEARLTFAARPDLPVAEGQAILSRLAPVAPGEADVALALWPDRLSTGDLAQIAHGEISVVVGGHAPGMRALRVAPAARRLGLLEAEVIRRSGPEGGAEVLARASYNPKLTSVLTAQFIAEKCALLLLRSLVALGTPGEGDGGIEAARPEAPGERLALPRSRDLPGYIGQAARAIATRWDDSRRRARDRGRDFWALSLVPGDLLDLDPAAGQPLPRLSHTMADPFLFEHNGETHVFYEAQKADGSAAWIDVARLEGERLVPLGTALRRDYHLSFPFVFRDGDDIFMMPETQSTRRLEVWRATRFPLEWELHATALEGRYPADSTLLRHDGTWLLFSNLSDHVRFHEHSSALYLFACDGPGLGGMVAHPRNPVVLGSDVSRNAGAVTATGGRLIRPSQINSFGVYGYGLNLMEIETLTPTRYRETRLRAFTPETLPGVLGLHHVTSAGGVCIFDWAGRSGQVVHP